MFSLKILKPLPLKSLSTPLLVISGPSGAGKSTLLTRLLAKHPKIFGFSISHTTRAPRLGEANGRHYHFTNRRDFESLRAQKHFFIETAEFAGNLYGTSVSAVKDVMDSGRMCVLDIELMGVKQIESNPYVQSKRVLIKPPDHESLRRRLQMRGTETAEAVEARLARALSELEFVEGSGIYDKVIINHDVDLAYQELDEYSMSLYRLVNKRDHV
ncbi:guanylate kinase [Choiromyces venosus 120613-1]|uniref:guanylate kinase n=1 Tax=Choiromyces venosus 120613-1 TaxID=1336337 RepID=A0A3N4J0P5_9PEZI|nr:guanylate kinase [Choiromyces venosus 120613-1]